MAENLTIARPYAKAVFGQALADQSLEEWDQILKILAAVASDKNAAKLLDNPLVSKPQLLALFEHVTIKALSKLSLVRQKELKNFLMVLINEKRLTVLPEIWRRYQQLVAAKQELKEVTVISAYPLDEQRRHSMTQALSRHLKSKVAIDFQEDLSLIGGALIRSGNWVMDGSIKGKLQNLRDGLQKM